MFLLALPAASLLREQLREQLLRLHWSDSGQFHSVTGNGGGPQGTGKYISFKASKN